jgi:K+-transporting ATPase KdpF subunit
LIHSSPQAATLDAILRAIAVSLLMENILVAIVSLGLLAYLFVALAKPEKF